MTEAKRLLWQSLSVNENPSMNLLTLSDKECIRIYSPRIKTRFADVDIAISCGDLSYFYLEYIISSLDIPLYYVRGNHANLTEYGPTCSRTSPWGAINLHKRAVRDKNTGLLLAGIEGCLNYNYGDFQYTQAQMWRMVFRLTPSLIQNKIRYGRFLDIFATHAPPWGIHDQEDRPHRGIKAFNWLLKTFQPSYHFHGHIHVCRPGIITETRLGKTQIMNTYGYRKIAFKKSPEIELPLYPTAEKQSAN